MGKEITAEGYCGSCHTRIYTTGDPLDDRTWRHSDTGYRRCDPNIIYLGKAWPAAIIVKESA